MPILLATLTNRAMVCSTLTPHPARNSLGQIGWPRHATHAQVPGTTTPQGMQQLHYGSPFIHPASKHEQALRHLTPAQVVGTSTHQDLHQICHDSELAHPNPEQAVKDFALATPATTVAAAASKSDSLIELAHAIPAPGLSGPSPATKDEIFQQSDMHCMRAQAQTARSTFDFRPQDTTQPVAQSQQQALPNMLSSQYNRGLHHPFLNDYAGQSLARAPTFGTGLQEASELVHAHYPRRTPLGQHSLDGFSGGERVQMGETNMNFAG
ncbi:hypothetical protein AC578_5677 [Pseudocercospora eumusae]|uniref:Uncharacterized protein n=1 Tax=Pseudocercospora eumusae TaxID=321146 RepID=A0A139H3F0_9PEZI|nr:hypothetical protein AC578_5677 [Pseudocercospora eumusae]